jgi:hypothetical protein
VRDRRAVGVGGARQFHLRQPPRAAQLSDRPPQRFLRFVPAAHATTLAGVSALCF